MKRQIFIVAGEASGDMHGASLIHEVKKRMDVEFVGIGGDEMVKAGLRLLMHNKELAVVGLLEVISHLPQILKAFNLSIKFIEKERVDLVVLIDYPGFNIRLGLKAKELGHKILYYIAPQVWAWKERRIHKLKRFVDKLAVILPFEEDYFKTRGINCSYVGNPLVESISRFDPGEKTSFFRRYSIKDNHTVISLLPGSRLGEFTRILPLLLDTARIIDNKLRDTVFLIPLASTIDPLIAYEMVEDSSLGIEYRIVAGDTWRAIRFSHLAILASGTVSLEACLLNTPQIVTYKLNPITTYLAKKLIRVPYLSLVNLIAGREIVPELFVDKANPKTISEYAINILRREELRNRMICGYEEVKRLLGEKNASAEVAKIVCEFLGETFLKKSFPLTPPSKNFNLYPLTRA